MAETLEANQARAVLRYFRMSPTKARQVLDLIRGKSAVEAIRALSLVNREASEVVGKLLASAVANATVRYGLGADEVFVAAAFADEGPTIKRFRPRARGRATRVRKRSCHITIVVEEMPLSMRRVEAAKNSGRQTARRAQRVASSRGTNTPTEASPRTPKAVDAGTSEVEEGLISDPSVEIVEDSVLEDTAEPAGVDEAVATDDSAEEVVVEASAEEVVVEASADEASAGNPADESKSDEVVDAEAVAGDDETPAVGQEDS
ncbi:50S ribosomal protein L22 [Ferrimicrobium sp.]|uniref:50S ribosomal protein L22 n=1 Tax=Ferrimicrobium sp. TaxID=2926050 RepID=UPI0034501987